MKIITLILFFSLALLSFAFLFQVKTITVKGSDTMIILGQRWL